MRATARRVDPYMLPAYRWMAAQLAARVPPPRSVTLPIWAWPVKPDLRGGRWFPRGTPGVRLELEIPAAETLASDFDAFHAVLNRCYLEVDASDDDRFQRALARSGAPDWPHTPALRARIERSWRRIFALDRSALVQVVLWQVRRDQVVRVERFTAR